MKRSASILPTVLLTFVMAACSPEAPQQAEHASDEQQARELVHVTSPHAETGGTLLEGPAFGEGGQLYVVDVMAPAGEAKVLRIDVQQATVEGVYTDESSAFTSAQFGPTDGRLYLTDFATGSVLSITSDGGAPQTVFAGEIDGLRMQPDDLTFDPDGNMFVTDTTGVLGPGWEDLGRVIRIGADGSASVLAENLPSPNGISFDEDESGLYVAQYHANRIDYYALDEARTTVTAAHPAVYVDAGRARVDSTAVDADGNIYQAFHGRPEIVVFAPDGRLLQTITVPGSGLESATNVAVAPGTTDGYVTVSGPGGGYVYTFEALAEGTRHSNGG